MESIEGTINFCPTFVSHVLFFFKSLYIFIVTKYKFHFQTAKVELTIVPLLPNQLEKVPNHEEYGMVSPRGSSGLVSPSCSQPTMRLMGKDVPIGRSSKEKQQFVGGVLWAEEESRRHYSVDAARDNSLLGRCYMPDSRVVKRVETHYFF